MEVGGRPGGGTAYRGGVRLRFLLRPGWLALTAVVFTFAICCFTLLSPWQFSRNTEREQQNSALETSFTAAPVPLAQLLPPGAVPGAAHRMAPRLDHRPVPAGQGSHRAAADGPG